MSSCSAGPSLKEEDIRTDDDLDYRWSLYRRDQLRLLERLPDFVEVGCPACDAQAGDLHYLRDGFTFKRCRACQTVYVSPRPARDLLLGHYRNSEAEKYWNEVVAPKTDAGRVEHLIRPRLEKIFSFCSRYGVVHGDLLDVGGGAGVFAAEAARSGRFGRVGVVEPDPSPAALCRAKGLTVYEDFVENLPAEAIADVATSFESIEHVFSPRDYLHSIARLLRPGGLLVLTTPNVLGFDLLTLKDLSDNTTAPDHLNYFHPASLGALLGVCGFTVLESLTPGKLDVELVRKKVQQGRLSLDGQPFLKRIVLDEFETLGASFQRWLAENGLSSHLWVVARRNG
jgi:2-polyprenyl-3-methyl-5-hydroxy-6-metoxy-1,4-benzoquinol methylase